MNIFGIGPQELLVIIVLAFVVLGPTRMTDTARKAGQIARDLRRMTAGIPKSLEDLEKLAEEPAKSKETAAKKEEAPPDATPWQPPSAKQSEPERPSSGA